MKDKIKIHKMIKRNKERIVASLLFLLFFLVVFVASNQDMRQASEGGTPKAAALHLFNDDLSPSNPLTPGEASSGYVIPRSVINNDFTIRLSVKTGDYDWGPIRNILSIEGNGSNDCVEGGNYPNRKRIQFTHDSSPNSHIDFHSSRCGVSVENLFYPSEQNNFRQDFGERSTTRAIATYEDYFLVYKKPISPDPERAIAGSDGYFRVYRSFEQNKSLIPQGLDFVKSGSYERYLNYIILKDKNSDWQGNDELFRLLIGDKLHTRQDIKVTELTMWTRALDPDMGINPSEPLYFGPYYSGVRDYDRYQSETINGITNKALDNAPLSYRNDLYFHFGNSDEGLVNNIWKNDAPSAPANIDIEYTGAASLTSDVPNWPNSNYPVASTAKPLTNSNDFTLNKIGVSEIEVSNIPIATAQGNASNVPLKTIIYLSASSNYKSATINKSAYVVQGPVVFDQLDLENKRYFVTVEWIDALENTKFITKEFANTITNNSSSLSVSTEYTIATPVRTAIPDTDINNDGVDDGYTMTYVNRIAKPSSAYKLPVNQPFTFRIVFKLNSLPAEGKSISIFGIQDSLREFDGYKAINIGANTSGGRTYMGISFMDGDKGYSLPANQINVPNNAIEAGQWEEFWFSYKYPTSTSPGELCVYRYKRATNELLTIYNNNTPQPIATSWFYDRYFKKWTTRMILGSTDNLWYANNFYINGASWWNSSLSQSEISGFAGKDILRMSRDERREDLLWSSGSEINNGIIDSRVGSLSEVYNLDLSCTQLESIYYYEPVTNAQGATEIKNTRTIVNPSVVDCSVADAPAFLNEDTTTPVISSLAQSYTDYVGYPILIEPIVSYADNFTWSVTDDNNTNNPIEFNSVEGKPASISVKSSHPTGKDQSYQIKIKALNTASDKFAERTTKIYIHKLADIDGKRNDDGSFDVDFDDFVLLLSSWGTPINPMANINRSGTSATKVDFDDFVALLSNWGGE